MEEVVLDRQPDGSWQAPGRKKPVRAAWQRLWFAAGCIYLLMLAVSFWLIVPDRERVERRMVSSVIEELRRYDGMAFAGESPDAIYRQARSDGFEAWIRQQRSRHRIGVEGDAGFNRIEQVYREELSSLTAKRVVAFLLCGIAWIVPMSVLYAIGFTVDWIRRGNRISRE